MAQAPSRKVASEATATEAAQSPGSARVAMHTWTLLSVSNIEGTPLVVAVCTVCGRIRRRSAGHDRHIDLRGRCPGEAQDPADDPRRRVAKGGAPQAGIK